MWRISGLNESKISSVKIALQLAWDQGSILHGIVCGVGFEESCTVSGLQPSCL